MTLTTPVPVTALLPSIKGKCKIFPVFMFDVPPFCLLCLKYPILLPGAWFVGSDLEERFFEGFIS